MISYNSDLMRRQTGLDFCDECGGLDIAAAASYFSRTAAAIAGDESATEQTRRRAADMWAFFASISEE